MASGYRSGYQSNSYTELGSTNPPNAFRTSPDYARNDPFKTHQDQRQTGYSTYGNNNPGFQNYPQPHGHQQYQGYQQSPQMDPSQDPQQGWHSGYLDEPLGTVPGSKRYETPCDSVTRKQTWTEYLFGGGPRKSKPPACIRDERYVGYILSIDAVLRDWESRLLSNIEACDIVDYYMGKIREVQEVDDENTHTLLEYNNMNEQRRADLDRLYRDCRQKCGRPEPYTFLAGGSKGKGKGKGKRGQGYGPDGYFPGEM